MLFGLLLWMALACFFHRTLAMSPCAVGDSTAYTGIRFFKQYEFTGSWRRTGYQLTECYLGEVKSITRLPGPQFFNNTLETRDHLYRISRRSQYVNKTKWWSQGTIIGGIYYTRNDPQGPQKNEWTALSPIVSDPRGRWIVTRENMTISFHQPIMRMPCITESAYPRTDEWRKYIDFRELY